MEITVWRETRVVKAPESTHQLIVTAHYADGSTQDVTPIARYFSDDDGIAGVTQRGVAIAPPATLPPEMWAPLLDRVAGAPFLKPVTLSQLVDQVAPDNPNMVYIVWNDGRWERTFTIYGHEGYDADIAFTRSSDGGITWEQDGFVPECKGVWDDHGRLMIVINHNTDLGDAYEHADNPLYPHYFSGYAYRVAINFVLYSLTH